MSYFIVNGLVITYTSEEDRKRKLEELREEIAQGKSNS